MQKTSQRYAAAIEQSLALFAERCDDPTEVVYEHLFISNPEMKALFWRDANGAIKSEMLSRVFDAILDFVGERRYADMMISNELITHEGYDVPRGVFATFFNSVAHGVEQILGDDWTAEMELGWRSMLADIDNLTQKASPSALDLV